MAKQLHDDLLEKCNVFYCLVPLLAQPLQCLVDLVAMKSHPCAAREFSSTCTEITRKSAVYKQATQFQVIAARFPHKNL